MRIGRKRVRADTQDVNITMVTAKADLLLDELSETVEQMAALLRAAARDTQGGDHVVPS